MGYRSDVTAIFYCDDMKDYPSMKLFINENLGYGETEWMREHIHEDSVGERKYVYFRADDVKWYETYSDVKAFDEFLEAFRKIADGDNDLKWAYEFARIGEDLNDIDVHGSDHSNNALNISRVVDISF